MPFFVFVFPDFDFCFLFNINVFAFEKDKLTKKQFWPKRGGGLQQNVFLMNLCFAKCKKLSIFLPFFANFGRCSKHY